MARVAEWRNDIGGNLSTGGSASAYTLTTNEGLNTPTPSTSQLIAFTVSATNAANATITIDSGSAYPLQIGGANVGAGVLVASSTYTAVFTGTAWSLRNFYGGPAGLIPLGAIIPYTGGSAPNSNFVFPFGQAISRSTYAAYFALVGTTYGVGDGSSTFNVADLRGRAVFGQDNMGGSAASRITTAGGNFDGTVIGNTGGGQNQTLTIAQLPASAPSGTWTFSGTPQTLNVAGGEVFSTSATAQGGSTFNAVNFSSAATGTVSVTPSGTITNGNLGSGNSHTILSPAMVLPYILRIL